MGFCIFYSFHQLNISHPWFEKLRRVLRRHILWTKNIRNEPQQAEISGKEKIMKAKPTRLLYYYPGKYDAQYMLEMDNGWYYLASPKQNTAYVFNQPLSLPSFYMGATWPKSSDELSPETKKEILDTIKTGNGKEAAVYRQDGQKTMKIHGPREIILTSTKKSPA